MCACVCTALTLHTAHVYDLQKCRDSFPFARVVAREWLEQVEKDRSSSTKGFECQLSIERFVNPYVPIPI